MSKHRDWCFTAYHDLQEFDLIDYDKIQYLIYQEEECPTTKRHHWQGYVEFKDVMRRNEVKKALGEPSAHCEPRAGTQQQALMYCKKSETRISEPIIFGHPKRQGSRSDLDGMVDMIEQGFTGREILLATRGNGLRHISHIYRGLNSFWNCEAIDTMILGDRTVREELASEAADLITMEKELKKRLNSTTNENASEVGGNTAGIKTLAPTNSPENHHGVSFLPSGQDDPSGSDALPLVPSSTGVANNNNNIYPNKKTKVTVKNKLGFWNCC